MTKMRLSKLLSDEVDVQTNALAYIAAGLFRIALELAELRKEYVNEGVNNRVTAHDLADKASRSGSQPRR